MLLFKNETPSRAVPGDDVDAPILFERLKQIGMIACLRPSAF